MSDESPPPEDGLPLAVLAALRASTGLLPDATLAEGLLTRFHFGLLPEDEDAALLARLSTDPDLGERSVIVRAQRDEWLRARPLAERLDLWPVDFWHMIDLLLPPGREPDDSSDETMVNSLLSDPTAILSPSSARKIPVLRIQAAERSVECIPAREFLTIKCALGLERDLGPMQGRRIKLRFGAITSDPARITLEGQVLVAAARFDASAAQALAQAAPPIRKLRLVPAS
jgi:hypothetical protein